MFREYIDNLIDPIPIQYVQTLRRLDNEPDYSLTCLGIALLRKRIENYNGICGKFDFIEREIDCVRNFMTEFEQYDGTPKLCYYTYTAEDDIDGFIAANLSEFKEKKSITKFVKDSTDKNCRAFYHETKNIAFVLANSGDTRLYHLLLTFIPLYFPAILSEDPMTEDEYALIKSLSKKEKDSFVKNIQKAVAPYSIEFRKIQLGSLLKQMHETKINTAKNAVDNKRKQVDDYEFRYTEAIRLLKEAIILYEGLKVVETYDDAEQELVNYLSTNDQIHNLNINNGVLYFTVATLLNNYNEQTWEVFANRGYIFDGKYNAVLLEAFNDKENRKILLNNLFSASPDFAVKICGNYKLDLNNCMLYTDKAYNYDKADLMYKSYMPNPHLRLFACLGGYRDRVVKELRNANYIGAIELCIASAGSVDLDECEQTFRPFLGWLLSSTEKVLRRADGVEMTPEEALIWLIDKEKDK